MVTFSPDKLRRVMAREGLNQTQLAKRLGISRATVSRWLSRKSQPLPRTLYTLKQEFPETSLDYYFNETA